MSAPFVEILIILALILTNGMFAMAEIAIVAARKERLQNLVRQGQSGASTALSLANDPNRFLSTIQIGITLVGIIAGAFGGATLAGRLADSFARVPAIERFSEALAFAIVVIGIAFLTVIFGELVPKRLGLRSPERVASSVAPTMRLLSNLATPIVVLLSWSTDAVLRLLNMRTAVDQPVTEDEINALMRQGLQSGSIESGEQRMVSGVFRLHDRSVGAFMTRRSDIVWLDVNATPDEVKKQIRQAKHSQFPVCEGGLENVIGVSSAKDLLDWMLHDNDADFRDVARPALFILETVTGSEVLNRFLEVDNNIGLVIDENGAVEGLVTIDDILDEIVGEDIRKPVREDDSWITDGRVGIEQLSELLEAPVRVPSDELGRYHTLGGFVMARLDRIPSVGDSFTWNGLNFEVQSMFRNQVRRIKITPELSTDEND